jgi:tetratricopeptide (TPR) repeat protein
MKQNIKTLFFIIAFACNNSFACLNYYHTVDQHGELHNLVDNQFVGLNKNFNLELIASKLPQFDADFQESQSPYVLSDYAVLLMKAGKIKESLSLLIALNKRLPNEYQIAANLGTAYELIGELDSALFYIKRGIEINPKAHGNSEWIHVKVLETKKRQLEDPNYLDSKSVLELTEFQKNNLSTRYELEIQIRERFPFTAGPDQIMASLMIDLGDCYANDVSIEYAKAFYNIANKYYGADSSITAPKIDQMVAHRAEYKDITPFGNWA